MSSAVQNNSKCTERLLTNFTDIFVLSINRTVHTVNLLLCPFPSFPTSHTATTWTVSSSSLLCASRDEYVLKQRTDRGLPSGCSYRGLVIDCAVKR
jgi:hypothetical protein